MGLFSTYQIATSGAKAASQKMSTVSQNITNGGTTGYKKSSADFEEALGQQLGDMSSPGSSMAGVRHARQVLNMSQGDIARSQVATDMAINGSGFFKVETKFGPAYSRDGSFNFNKEGELVNGDGHKVVGFKIGPDGTPTNSQSPIKLDKATIAGTPTSEVKMILNLDAREDNKIFDPTNPSETSNFSKTVKVVDSQSNEKYVTVYFTKTADNSWQYNAMVNGTDAPGGVQGQEYPGASGTLQFSPEGRLQSEQAISSTLSFAQSGNQNIQFDFGQALGEGGDGANASTGYGTDSSVSKFSENGRKKAQITSLGFGPNGVMQAFYDNGSTRDIAQVAIADFTNAQGLKKIGSNLFLESSQSGQASVGEAGKDGRGEILSQSLELSNVDIATEFTELMSTQQSFNANSKTMSTTDQLLKTIINVKG